MRTARRRRLLMKMLSPFTCRKTSQELPYLVDEAGSGRVMQDFLLDQKGALPVQRKSPRIGRQVAAGFRRACAPGRINYRDIKPAETYCFEAKTGSIPTSPTLTGKLGGGGFQTNLRAVLFRALPVIHAPEQARGELLDHRSDLFSLGSVLYAMATGNPPFQGSSAFCMLRKVTQTRQQPVQAVSIRKSPTNWPV